MKRGSCHKRGPRTIPDIVIDGSPGAYRRVYDCGVRIAVLLLASLLTACGAVGGAPTPSDSASVAPAPAPTREPSELPPGAAELERAAGSLVLDEDDRHVQSACTPRQRVDALNDPISVGRRVVGVEQGVLNIDDEQG